MYWKIWTYIIFEIQWFCFEGKCTCLKIFTLLFSMSLKNSLPDTSYWMKLISGVHSSYWDLLKDSATETEPAPVYDKHLSWYIIQQQKIDHYITSKSFY